MLGGGCASVHVGRSSDAVVDVIGSAIVLLRSGAPVMFILVLGVLEWVVHFHIDFGKARFSERRKLNPQQAMFWQAMGSDQALHQLTYIAMAWAWVKYAAM